MAQTQTQTPRPPAAAPPPPSTTKKKHSNKPQPSSATATTSGGGMPFKTMELAPAPRKRPKKAPVNTISDKVAAVLPESAIYTELLDIEAKVDSALAKKRIEIMQSVNTPPCFSKILRVYVFNTFANQPLDSGDCKGSEPPTWTLKITGNLVDDGGVNCESVAGQKGVCNPKFSSFFKKITIYLDPNLYPENHVIVWENSKSPVLHQGFEVKRKGSKEFTAVVRLEMNYIHMRFKLSAALSDALGIEVETRERVMTALWQYVKVKKLQDVNDPAFFNCDPGLKNVFGEEKVKFAVASQKLTQHLAPVQPIYLEHKVKLSGNNPSGNVCHDVLVDIPFPLEDDMSDFLGRMEKCKEIDDYDNAIAGAIKKMNEHRRRHAFFLGFSQSPAEFINTLVSSQDRDLKVVGGDAIHNAEKERRSDFYNQPWLEDAVLRYLNRKPAGGSETAGTT